tara:strand:+ start:47 stop:226 length:180 start_codon:yes stop_codon:yes gene_type:complete
MKIFLTTFLHDKREYEGPDIHAETEEEALMIAESQGLILEGELTELYSLGDEVRPRVLH